MVKKITGVDFRVKETGRRAGDAPVLVAANEKVKRAFNWTPRYDDLGYIIQTAWEWERRREIH
jgi:UDP-glucose 4-epimerase